MIFDDLEKILIKDLGQLGEIHAPQRLITRIEAAASQLERHSVTQNRRQFKLAYVQAAFVWLVVIIGGSVFGYITSLSRPGDALYPIKVGAFRFVQQLNTNPYDGVPVQTPSVTPTPTPTPTSIHPDNVIPTNASVRIVTTPTPEIYVHPTNSEVLPVLGNQAPTPTFTPILEEAVDVLDTSVEIDIPLVPVKIGL